MNDNQNAKLNMAQRVLDTLKRNEDLYRKIPTMGLIVEELNSDILNIREVQRQQSNINVPASTRNKRMAETKMIKSCVKIANLLYLIGFTTNNNDLITLNGLSENSFYRLADNAALALAKQILILAKKYSNELKNHSIEEKEINEIETSIEAFHNLIAKPMDTITERKEKTTNLVQLFAKLDSTLYDKLNKIMVIFKDSNISFYNEYRTSRNLILTSARHKNND